MSEPLTSKQKGDLEWYMSEVERLTRERDDLIHDVERLYAASAEVCNSEASLRAERDRLLAECAANALDAQCLENGNKRLRAALEHVAYSGCPYETCVTIAKSGLAGAAVETDAHHCPSCQCPELEKAGYK